jgi:F-type H+-transporting ATPase subunit b
LIAPVSNFAESSSGIGALGVDGKAFLIQLITFGLAFLVLQRFAFKPILKVMEQRRQTIESGVALGEAMKQKQAELEKEVGTALAKARHDADGIIAEARDAAKAAGAELEAKAKKRADGLVAAAEDRISQDTKRARQKLEKELVGLVSEVTETIIGEKVDAKKDAQLIDRALKGGAR